MSRFDRLNGLLRGVGQFEGSLGSRNPGFYSRAIRVIFALKSVFCYFDLKIILLKQLSNKFALVLKFPLKPYSLSLKCKKGRFTFSLYEKSEKNVSASKLIHKNTFF